MVRRVRKPKQRKRPQRKVPRGLRNVPGRLLVTKSTFLQTISPSTGTGAALGSLQFSISMVQDLVTLASQFDQYRINAVALMLQPAMNVDGNATNNKAGLFYSYIDYTDASPPAGQQEIFDKPKFKMHRIDRPWNEYISHPTPITQEYNSATTTAYAKSKPVYISADYTAVPHFGWKYMMVDTPDGQNVRIFAKLYVEYRDPR